MELSQEEKREREKFEQTLNHVGENKDDKGEWNGMRMPRLMLVFISSLFRSLSLSRTGALSHTILWLVWIQFAPDYSNLSELQKKNGIIGGRRSE